MSATARLIALTAVVLLTCIRPASAALEVCNRTSYILYTASATLTPADSTSQGWTRITPGACQNVLPGDLSAAAYFLYAHTSQAHAGPERAWGGDHPICVRDINFTNRSAASARDCPSDNFYALPFVKIDTHRKTSWMSTLSESPAIATLTDARTAGLKRLLHDLGYRIAAIDGHPDRESEAALADFRKRQHVATQASALDLFDALETNALKVVTPAGYSVCNDTTKPIAAALGEKTATDWISHGWWKVAPGSCARAITTPLATDSLFLYAQTIGGPPLVSGGEKFCVADIEFDIQGRLRCKDRGLAELGFAQTNVKDMAGFAAHIGETGLVPVPRRTATPNLPHGR